MPGYTNKELKKIADNNGGDLITCEDCKKVLAVATTHGEMELYCPDCFIESISYADDEVEEIGGELE